MFFLFFLKIYSLFSLLNGGIRWLPVDVAKIWGCHWLETLLSPKSRMIIPAFPPSSYLSFPLTSILNIARYFISLPECASCFLFLPQLSEDVARYQHIRKTWSANAWERIEISTEDKEIVIRLSFASHSCVMTNNSYSEILLLMFCGVVIIFTKSLCAESMVCSYHLHSPMIVMIMMFAPFASKDLAM